MTATAPIISSRYDGPDLFYPVVPDVQWIARLVPLGVRTIQLRLKDVSDDEVERQISESIEICRDHNCVLIVNDYWRAAIKLQAKSIHLGQEDLSTADVAAIKSAGVRLGISSHDHEELDTALAADPWYVALGPVYETKLKKMKWAPQGLQRVTEWRRRAGRPLVAIGGITVERAGGVQQAGADSIAVVTDIITHDSPEARTGEWLSWAGANRN